MSRSTFLISYTNEEAVLPVSILPFTRFTSPWRKYNWEIGSCKLIRNLSYPNISIQASSANKGWVNYYPPRLDAPINNQFDAGKLVFDFDHLRDIILRKKNLLILVFLLRALDLQSRHGRCYLVICFNYNRNIATRSLTEKRIIHF